MSRTADEYSLLSASNEWFLTRICVGGALLSLLIAGLYSWLTSPSDVYASCGSFTVCIGALLTWRAASQRRLVIHLAIASLTAMFATLIAFGSSAYVAWLGLMPILAFMLLGRRAGLAWTAAILSLVVGLMLFTAYAGVAQLVESSLSVRMLRVVVLVPTLAMVGHFFEQQRRQHITSLEHAVSARSRLLANVSHEMRTPLNGIIGLTQALQLEPLPESIRETLGVIQQSGETLLSLINDLLDVARAEAGKTEVSNHPFNLTELVEQTVALHRARAEAVGVAITVERAPEALWVVSDAARIRQVLGNLIANAIRHGGGSSVTVSVRAVDAGAQVHVSLVVTDHGPGLSAVQRERLFQPFVQLDPSTASGGSGLGLFISRSLALALGGDLAVDSEGGGTAFRFMLVVPRAAAQVSLQAPHFEPLAGVILVVDDNEINRRVAKALLSKIGLTVETVESGEISLVRAAESAFDLILMDLQMPTLDGFETARRLRSAGYRGPIFALTASAQLETPAECAAAGMDGCWVKPLRLEQVYPVLERTLRKPSLS